MELHRCMGCMGITENAVCEKCGWPMEKNNGPHQLPVGYVLRGQYTVGRVLGQGGFGITYLGWDSFLEIPVAIKEFYPNSMVSRECAVTAKVHCFTEQVTPQYVMSKERFLREAKALARFEDEPAIVRIRNFFEENDTAYIVMEYVRGTNLAAYVNMRGGKLAPQEALRILRPVMEALAVVHEADLVHRDISPDNIMLHPRGGAKLLDFGAVRNVENAEAGKDMARSTEAILKHGFAPMEQYQSRGGLGPWTDEYALCATIYYCITGRIPEEAPRRMLEEIDPDWDIPGLLPHQQKALSKGMALRARDRYATVRELIDALFNETPVPEPAPKPEPKPKPVPKPRPKPEPKPKPMPKPRPEPVIKDPVRIKWWIIPVIAAVLVVAALAVFAMIPRGWQKDDDGEYRYYAMGTALTDRWIREGDLWYHLNSEGTMDIGWVKVDGQQYYFGADGARVTQWRNINKKQYYFGTDGILVTGQREIDGKTYLFNDRGVMQTGWKLVGDTRYYFRDDGSRAEGWETIGQETYYFDDAGIKAVGWMTIDGKTYYFDTFGVMQTGLKSVGTSYYIFDAEGVMELGWVTIGSNTYYCMKDGRLCTGWLTDKGRTYHFSVNGVMHTGWKTIDGSTYYFDYSGIMQTGWQIIDQSRYYFGKDGKMYTGSQKIDGRWYTFSATGELQ